MNILIIAPHQDDEILAACLLIQSQVRAGHEIFVAFATNGDRRGREAGARRYQESVRALRLLHVEEDHIFYMGYGDTGMRLGHSFLYRMFSSAGRTLIPAPISSQTYHPAAGRQTLHHACTGGEAAYCRDNFLEDLDRLLDVCRAELVVLPSELDCHGDHRACFLFMNELRRMRDGFPNMLTYLIHAGDDMFWPNRTGEVFGRPPSMDLARWDKRVSIRVTETEQVVKELCIRCFQSQDPLAQDSFLLSFAKREEIFFPFPPN